MRREAWIWAGTAAVVIVVFLGTLIAFSPGTASTTSAYPTFSLPYSSTTQGIGGTRGAFESHMLAIESENVTTVMSGYSGDPTLVLTGNHAFEASGLAGRYQGAASVKGFYSEFLADVTVTFGTPDFVSYGASSLNASIAFQGISTLIGPISGTLSDQASFVSSTGGLLISSETLAFTNFTAPHAPGG